MMRAAAFLATVFLASVGAAAQSGPGAPRVASSSGCTISAGTPTRLFVGVSAFDLTFSCPGNNGSTTAHAIQVDLTQSGLSFVASTGVGNAFQTELPTAFLVRTGSQVAFNANLFTGCCNYAQSMPAQIQGLLAGGGQIYAPAGGNPVPSQQFPFNASLIALGGALSIMPSNAVEPGGVDAAITGSHLLVLSGQNIAPDFTSATDFFIPNARTLVGLSPTNQTLWVVAVDGGATSSGLTLPQAGDLMIALGAASALNLDGGGSTTLAIQGSNGAPQIINTPSDSAGQCTVSGNGWCERYVGASFGIRASALPTAVRRRVSRRR